VDQCRRCDGYPRALQEAHEQAVISGNDRLQFGRLLEMEVGRHGLRSLSNSKQVSKRRRGL
jgi:NurA-like 5'-3' nuclease